MGAVCEHLTYHGALDPANEAARCRQQKTQTVIRSARTKTVSGGLSTTTENRSPAPCPAKRWRWKWPQCSRTSVLHRQQKSVKRPQRAAPVAKRNGTSQIGRAHV